MANSHAEPSDLPVCPSRSQETSMSVPLRVLILEDRPADVQLMLHELR